MLVLVARNCTKPISDLSVKKHLVLIFVGFPKMKLFFLVLKLPILNISRLSYDSQAKNLLRFSNVFSTKTQIYCRKIRFEHSVPKTTVKCSIYRLILGLIFEK